MKVVCDAVVLAAGNGDRFVNGARRSKLLEPVLGVPLIIRTLHSARAAGITRVDVVLGYEAERLRTAIENAAPPGLVGQFHINPDWHRENGLSVLAARSEFATRRFALLMGDHIFDPAALKALLTTEARQDESLIGIDRRPVTCEIADEATRVRLDGDQVVAIGKQLTPYDALDTGIFVCAPTVFEAIAASAAEGDTSLTAGIRRLAAAKLVGAVDIGDALWRDIDTVADLRAAETILSEL